MPMRPPGRRTRAISAKTAGLSPGGWGAGGGEHLVGHVEAEDPAARTHASRREEHVDAAARAEVEDALALVQLGDRDGVAAAEAGQARRLGRRGGGRVVETGPESHAPLGG